MVHGWTDRRHERWLRQPRRLGPRRRIRHRGSHCHAHEGLLAPVVCAPQSCVVLAADAFVVGDRTPIRLSLGVDHHRPARCSSIRGLVPHHAQLAGQLGRRVPRAAALSSDTQASIAGAAACAALGHVTRGHRGVTGASDTVSHRPSSRHFTRRSVEVPRGQREPDRPLGGEQLLQTSWFGHCRQDLPIAQGKPGHATI